MGFGQPQKGVVSRNRFKPGEIQKVRVFGAFNLTEDMVGPSQRVYIQDEHGPFLSAVLAPASRCPSPDRSFMLSAALWWTCVCNKDEAVDHAKGSCWSYPSRISIHFRKVSLEQTAFR